MAVKKFFFKKEEVRKESKALLITLGILSGYGLFSLIGFILQLIIVRFQASPAIISLIGYFPYVFLIIYLLAGIWVYYLIKDKILKRAFVITAAVFLLTFVYQLLRSRGIF